MPLWAIVLLVVVVVLLFIYVILPAMGGHAAFVGLPFWLRSRRARTGVRR